MDDDRSDHYVHPIKKEKAGLVSALLPGVGILFKQDVDDRVFLWVSGGRYRI
jgi:hypothetical protein